MKNSDGFTPELCSPEFLSSDSGSASEGSEEERQHCHTLTFLCAAFKHACTHLAGLSTLLTVSDVSCYSSSILWNAVLVPALFLGFCLITESVTDPVHVLL